MNSVISVGVNMPETELIAAFHDLWDNFPGLARLIDVHHRILASNPQAVEAGFTEGALCSTVGDASLHRACKLMMAIQQEEAMIYTEIEGRIRGWIPVKGQEGICVHFTLPMAQ